MATVRAEGLAKRYGETVALDGVSLAVEAGEVFGLLGPNGAGKTTLIRCLTGTATPDSGTAELLGEPPAAAPKNQIGLLPQDFRPPDRLTARELLTYHAGLYEDPRDVDAVLADVGLEADAGTRYGNLSGGQQRRTCVGIAVVNDPEVLILDEPTTGIDPAGRRAVWGLLEELAGGGTTVLLTTHYTGEADRLADRVGVLVEGELVAADTPEGLTERYGGPPRLRIDTEADPDAIVGNPGGYPIRREEGALVIEGVTPEAIPGVLEAIRGADVTYDALTWRRPDLEAVYLQLAGEPADAAAVEGGT